MAIAPGIKRVTSGLKTSEVNAEKKFGISQCSPSLDCLSENGARLVPAKVSFGNWERERNSTITYEAFVAY